MKMIDKYIHDVTSRLSPAVQDDVALELKSSIGDMLPPDYTEEDVKEVLAEFGDPIKLASQYREHPSYSFGQQVYDFCSSSLKVTGFIFIYDSCNSCYGSYDSYYRRRRPFHISYGHKW
ncbi:hypothetical protein [Sinobaca sp. H24]|uniref:HAAS signaling domain-containing protein n=1 Tax=Sinobaca sp. H24 TaxID=2923376 RepID=UPI00207A783D|nr:hypothetical protein [Sinobaca sp. H24]